MEQKQKRCDVGVEISLPTPDSFSIIRESLTRIGIQSKRSKTLYQTCHILHTQGKYYVVHFLEMFLRDGKTSTITDDDYRRRNTVAKLLSDWKLCTVLNKDQINGQCPIADLKIVPFKEKAQWSLIPKYQMGSVRKKDPNRV